MAKSTNPFRYFDSSPRKMLPCGERWWQENKLWATLFHAVITASKSV